MFEIWISGRDNMSDYQLEVLKELYLRDINVHEADSKYGREVLSDLCHEHHFVGIYCKTAFFGDAYYSMTELGREELKKIL